jgi:hypothetical protein
MLPGPGEPSVLARDMLGMRTLYQLDFAFRPLTLHAEDLPPTLEDARRPRLKAERDFYSNQTVELQTHNQVLTETATQYALRVQELERELLAARTEIAANDYPRLKAERDFYSNRMVELQTHNQVLTETATKFARRLQGHLEVKEGLPALPSILFTSIPKSGTVFTGQMLSRGLGLELVRLTAGSFPRYLFDLPRLVQFSAGGMIATEHFDASPEIVHDLARPHQRQPLRGHQSHVRSTQAAITVPPASATTACPPRGREDRSVRSCRERCRIRRRTPRGFSRRRG